ncbi:MAG TPA: c-type cytochrome [Actinomycetota bacterium]|nr:c-type cytochrome [Actinomycetota bacterium]
MSGPKSLSSRRARTPRHSPMIRTLGAAAVAGLGALMLAGCGYFNQSTAPYRPKGFLTSPGPADGFTIYARDCSWCHGPQGQGSANGPALTGESNGPALTDFMLSTGRMPIVDPDQKDALHQPSIYDMAEINALVAYVSTFNSSGPPVPTVDLSAGSLTQGASLYQANCAACHSVTGEGGALATGKVATINGFQLPRNGLAVPSLLKADPIEVAEAIRTGPPGMPDFGPSELSATQVDSIARYVKYLQTAPDRGGLGLGRIGPVAEGAIGWLVGLGLLVLFVRWIGTSSRERSGHGHGGHGSGEDG